MAKLSFPSIPRISVRSPWDADEPQRRDDLNAQRALGRVLDQYEWWVVWTRRSATHPSLQQSRTRWIRELEVGLVRDHVTQVLAVWSESRSIDWGYLVPRAVRAAGLFATTPDEKRVAVDTVFREMVRMVLSSSFFCVGELDAEDGSAFDYDHSSSDEEDNEEGDESMEGDEDSGDDFALNQAGDLVPFDVAVEEARAWRRAQGQDEADDEEEEDADEEDEDDEEEEDASMDESDSIGQASVGRDHLDRIHQRENPFGQLAWFVNLLITRERLLALSPDEATHAVVTQILRAGPSRDNATTIDRTVDLIVTALETTSESWRVRVPECVSADVLRILHMHMEAVRAFIQATMDDVATTLNVIVQHLELDFVNEDDEAKEGSFKPIYTPGPVALTWISDEPMPSDINATFTSELFSLRQQARRATSTHGLRHLVDPSMYCAIAGRTPYKPWLRHDMTSYATPAQHLQAMMNASTATSSTISNHIDAFQWLPCEIHIDAENGAAKILTYINNLHPETFARLYALIEHVLTQSIPLFEHVLSALDVGADLRTLQGLYEHCNYALPRAPRLVPRGLFDAETRLVSLKGRTCQVVIRVSEVELSPATPVFDGDAWRCEGADTDQIIATAVYMYDCENLSTPQFEFRTYVKFPNLCPDDDTTLGLTYGLQSHDLLVQYLGSITARLGRCVVFPNRYQYRLAPCSLVDRTRHGRLGLLTFSLVTPMANPPIISTAVVPPQQADWIQRIRDPLLRRFALPETIEALVRAYARDGMNTDEAHEQCKRLTQHRARPIAESDYVWFHRREHW